MTTEDIRSRLDSALTVLAALNTNEPHVLRRALVLAGDALRAARGALDEADDELDVLTAPDRNSAAEVVRLEKELATARDRAVALEQDLAMLRHERDLETQVQAVDRKRLADLEKRVAQYESSLLKDDDAFSRYMDKAVEEDEKKRGRKPPPR